MAESTWRWECGRCGAVNNAAIARCPGQMGSDRRVAECDGSRPTEPPDVIGKIPAPEASRDSVIACMGAASLQLVAQLPQDELRRMGTGEWTESVVRLAAAMAQHAERLKWYAA